MKFNFFGRELHFDFSKRGESWDMAVLIQQAAAGENGEPTVKSHVVPYRVVFGLVIPELTQRSITHFICGRLMVTIYGREKES